MIQKLKTKEFQEIKIFKILYSGILLTSHKDNSVNPVDYPGFYSGKRWVGEAE